ncbi:STAS domain-containing protein [Streptomyces sp. NPDC049813]|uniref:STAS domain-containing protein n=1 Tax=Streptomyces sp. NPDC049813 TaxID=3365597 RepID=UPI00378F8F12
MTDLSVTTRILPAGAAIEVSGDLDHHTAPRIRGVLPTLPLGHGQQLLVDLGALTFCDSSGITALIAARNHAMAAGATLALVAVPDRVRRIFTMVGLDRVFPTYPTVQDAEAAWQPPPAE